MKFSSTVKPFFADTIKLVNSIISSDNYKMLRSEKKVAKILNNYITNLTRKLKLKLIIFDGTVDSIENHNSIGRIKGYYKDELSFEFKEFRNNELLKVMKQFSSTVTVLNKIKIRIIKNSTQIYSSKLTQMLKHCVFTAGFPDLLKYPDVTSVLNKVTAQENYIHTNTSSNFSNTFENLIYN